GRFVGDADGEVSNCGGDKIKPGVRRLGENTQTAGRDADDHFHQRDRHRGIDGVQGNGLLLRSHAGRADGLRHMLDYSLSAAIRQPQPEGQKPIAGLRCVRIFLAFPCSAPGGTTPEDYHFMSRSTLMALAISCVLSCASYAQDPAAKPQQPATTATSSAAQAPAATPTSAAPPTPPANTLPSTSVVSLTEPVLTLKGACQPKDGTAPPAGCVSSLTREQ